VYISFKVGGMCMYGFVQFAQSLVNAVSNVSPFPISLSHKDGEIIGDATNTDRIGTIHQPSLKVLQANTTLTFHKEDIKGTENVLPGVATPLIFDHKAIMVLGIIGDPKEVEPYAILMKNYVEMMWQETFRKQIEDLETKALETFVQYLISADCITHENVEQYCRMFHVAYNQRRFCIIVDIGSSLLDSINGETQIGIDSFKKTLLNSTKKSFLDRDDSVCAFLNTEKIILLIPVSSDDDFLQMMHGFTERCKKLIQLFQNYGIAHTTIAAGSTYPNLHHIKQSYKEAEDLLKVGKELSISPPFYHAYNWDVQLALLPQKIEQNSRDQLRFLLNPLFEKEDFTELARSFIMYCTHNLNISKAAKALYIHRNTLIYRLNKIEKITFIDSGKFEHCLLLYLVLKE